MDVETIFRPTHDAKRKTKPTDFSCLALQHVPDDLNLFRFHIEVKAVVFNDVPLGNVHVKPEIVDNTTNTCAGILVWIDWMRPPSGRSAKEAKMAVPCRFEFSNTYIGDTNVLIP